VQTFEFIIKETIILNDNTVYTRKLKGSPRYWVGGKICSVADLKEREGYIPSEKEKERMMIKINGAIYSFYDGDRIYTENCLLAPDALFAQADQQVIDD
jgi:hypothetical protein